MHISKKSCTFVRYFLNTNDKIQTKQKIYTDKIPVSDGFGQSTRLSGFALKRKKNKSVEYE